MGVPLPSRVHDPLVDRLSNRVHPVPDSVTHKPDLFTTPLLGRGCERACDLWTYHQLLLHGRSEVSCVLSA